MLRVAAIVEGHGDVEAVPILIRRIAATVLPGCHVEVLRPIRASRSKLLLPGEVERVTELAVRKVAGQGLVLIVLDSDDDCPAQLGPQIKNRAWRDCPGLHFAVALAMREFEAWFIAAAESLRGRRGLPDDIASPTNPESIRGAKEWLSRQMPRNQNYFESLDQPALAAVFDLQAARACPSFDRFYRIIESFAHKA